MTEKDPSIGIDQADKTHHTYLLRRIPMDLWIRAQARAKQDDGGISMRVALVRFIREYGLGRPGNRRSRRPDEHDAQDEGGNVRSD